MRGGACARTLLEEIMSVPDRLLSGTLNSIKRKDQFQAGRLS
jgi:hypothetical protein